MRFFADGMPLVGQSPRSVRSRSPSCLPMYYHRLIQQFVRRKPCWPDKIQKSYTLSGQNAIHRTNSAEGLWTVRISQKAFSHMSNLCRWNLCRRNSDRAEILKGKGTVFSWEWSFHTFRIGFDVKAFRKSAPTSARVGRNKDSPPLVPWSEAAGRNLNDSRNKHWNQRTFSGHMDTGWHSSAGENERQIEEFEALRYKIVVLPLNL